MREKLLSRICLFVTIAVFASIQTAHSNPITRQKALQNASEFLQKKGITLKNTTLRHAPALQGNDSSENAPYYVFNIGDDNGFVIASGDDRSEQVLGYSTTGHIDPATMPENMKYYLDELVKETASVESNETGGARRIKRLAPTKRAIAPLITTSWDQDSPFNNMAPYVIQDNGDTVRCVTGCVATAMAQVMNFYKYPDATIADIPGYSLNKIGFVIDAIPAGTTIDWSNMADTYDNNSTAAQCDAVAKLMYLCGVSVTMSYGVSSSSASTTTTPFIRYFGYGKQARFCEKKNYSSLAWFNLIYNELAEGYPLYSDGGSHAYVIDGYDGDNMFHFNWGWGPGSGGYYLLSAISEYYPDGTTGSTTSYTSGQGAIIGLRPATDGNSAVSTVKLKSCINDSTLEVQMTHPAGLAEECAYGIGYINDDLSVVPINVCYEDWPYFENGTYLSTQPFIIRGLSKGNYRVVAIKKNEGSTVWRAGEDAELTFAKVNIDDDGTISTTMYGYTTDIRVDSMVFLNDPTFGSNKVKAYVTKNVDDGMTFEGDVILYSIKETKSGNSTYTSYHKYDTKSVVLKGNEGKWLDMSAFLSSTYYGISDTDSVFTFRFCQGDFNGKKLGDFNVLVKASPRISKNLAMTMSPTIESFNTDEKYLYGKTLKMKVLVINENDSDYVGTVEARLTVGNRTSTSSRSICLQAGQQTEVEFEMSPSFTTSQYYNTTCKLELSNYCYDGVLSFTRIVHSTFEPLIFTLRPGIKLYYDDGSSECFEAPSSFSAPVNATAIDIRKQNALESLTLANPNCLVFTDDYSGIPSDVITNIVKSGKSDDVTLTDGYSFATPEKFTATNISYTRTFTKGYREDGSGWTTICLPFDVAGVKVNNGGTATTIDWFHSSTDMGKSFWVREFSADNAPMMRFAPASQMLATHPYIISFPDGNSGIGMTLTGKPVTFYGTEAVITPTFRCQTLGYTYRMIGVMSPSTVNMGFGHSDGDKEFVKQSPLTVQPFRAYFDPVTTGAQSRDRIILAGESEEEGDGPSEQEEEMELVDLGLSVKWANKNLGALTAERPGQLLSWGELSPKASYYFDQYEFYDQSSGSFTNIGSDISATQYDAAYSQSGGKYRMPTRAEMQELVKNCTFTNEVVNGVDGFRVTGPNGNSIFMPASGYRQYTSLQYISNGSSNMKCGFYWTSEPYGSNNTSLYAYSLTIGPDGTRNLNRFRRDYGLAIRPVENRGAILGDLNHDGTVDITDVVLLVNHILGNTSSTTFTTQDADINEDGNIDISDVVALVNFILEQEM